MNNGVLYAAWLCMYTTVFHPADKENKKNKENKENILMLLLPKCKFCAFNFVCLN